MRHPGLLFASIVLLLVCVRLDAQVTFRLGDATARPGETDVVVPISIDVGSDDFIVEGWQMFIGVDMTLVDGVTIVGTRSADFFSFIGPFDVFTPDAVGAATVYSFLDDPELQLSRANDGIVAELHLCVGAEVDAGTYDLAFLDSVEREVGPMSNEAAFDGESFEPTLVGGTLTVSGGSTSGTCSLPTSGSNNPPPLRATVELGDTEAQPGAAGVTIPIEASADDPNAELTAWSVLLSYDATTLASLSISPRGDPDFFLFRGQNEFVDAGFVGALATYSGEAGSAFLPASAQIATLSFCVLPTAGEGGTSIAVRPATRIKDGERASFERMRTTLDFLAESGVAHVASPALRSGSVTIAGVPVDGACSPDEFDPPLPPAGFELVYELSGPLVPVAPGSVVDVGFSLVSNQPIQGYSVALEWNDPDLDFLEISFDQSLYSDTAFQTHLEGPDALVFAGIFDLRSAGTTLPPNTTDPINTMTFLLSPDISEGTTTISFADSLDGSRLDGGGPLITNIAVVDAEAIDPEFSELQISYSEKRDLVLNVAPDVTLFIRGDANGDSVVDVSDPRFTLDHLFLGGPASDCQDAADANDDGKVEISDPVRTLGRLFLGAPPLPSPSLRPGSDPTPDELECATPFTND